MFPSRSLPRLSRELRLALMGLLTALVLTLGLVLVPGLAGHTFAATRDTSVTCFSMDHPDSAHCDQQDPRAEQCANDEVITVEAPILDANLHRVGRLQRRQSVACHTWWARIYDDRPTPGPKFFVSLGTRDLTLPYKGMAYTDMVFDESEAHPPVIIGSLSTPDGKPDAGLTANVSDPPAPLPITPTPAPVSKQTTPTPTPTPAKKATPLPRQATPPPQPTVGPIPSRIGY